MTEAKENLDAVFDPSGNGLPPDILGVLESTLRLHSLTAEELFIKWEVYCLKMGSEETKLDLETARMFAKDVQDSVERGDSRAQQQGSKFAPKSDRKSAVHATPRAVGTGDVFGMLDELTPNALPRRSGSVKRKADFDSPVPKRVSRSDTSKTPGKAGKIDGSAGIPFSERPNAGQIIETINDHLPQAEAPLAPFSEARLRLISRTDFKKFTYKPMSMRLSDASEILDERIDDFLALVQKHHNLEDSAFGNAAAQSTSEIIAVGRIASDTPEGKLNSASLVLEMSRRMGAGLRVPLKVDALPSYQFFPGQIVAVKGTNASGLYFTVKEVLSIPKLPMPLSTTSEIAAVNERLEVSEDSTTTLPLNIMISSGPYTADDNLAFEPFQALCEKAADSMADALILTGPFLDIEHPMLGSGDFDIPETRGLDNESSMAALFKTWISPHLQRLCAAVPSITVIMVPSVRDAVSKHVSWPQERLVKKDLALPKQVTMLPNPCFVSLNETVFAISSQDVLFELSREQLSHGMGGVGSDLLSRLPGCLIEQRHFFPLFPPMARGNGATKGSGACLDLGYLKLGDWMQVKPDVLVLPSLVTASVKVVDSVMVLNPGQLSKRKAAGTYAQISLQPRVMSEEEKAERTLSHKVFERARVDVVRI
ncbi:DNA-directed DNA polymerase alpha subunit pol12 [Exophiala xenobiotica]|uniref:DNA polymerase alpha subunit B n=1 Tax=Vermiconidia calcicola TaxID=1690605 RepID=A0AAV9QC62_9PEZI|nr:DNA-directed DNA polymerase alpha subunit pol12 [Exophiala xenobiotica]KAK5536382.1 DNA-directed DNA polymerase alpha subunit pol12 [Chaetothyriales sp. CCFEE 6169]KAK5540209.1 DNA-directed DNA polymerase alpha subunit pol12 [Vermiconidia calcicola]KAK5259355.1 DNA-directed DNA polymerase alpha subunit pol12 [Exophiala xenobiotica]KAK5265887.1 DNA-directed DNA polymerase alpha subunit pol12 [Exophiala xenobiotica]